MGARIAARKTTSGRSSGAGGRVVYFEGTYTEMFSGNPVATPRYDYNQLLYRLDLDDPRLRAARAADATR